MRERTAVGGGRLLAVVTVVVALLVAVLPAHANEIAQTARTTQVPPVEPYAPFEPQDDCDPSPKPGVVAFAKLLLEAYPVSGWSGISRDCGVRGRSEHKEGRAFDWAVSVDNPKQRASAEDALATLLATDDAGNRHALFRRFGLMYVIWNRQIFSATQADAGWRPYACNSAASYDDCHVRHVHFSFSTPGAMMRTSWWQMTPAATNPAEIERVSSTTRADTAVEISGSAFPTRGSADHVFLADAAKPHDALVASVMAGAAHGAVLLTEGADALEPKVDAELRRLLGDRGSVTLVGNAVADAVVRDHADTYKIRRVAGADRFATARAAALDMQRIGRSSTAVVAGVDALDEALPMVAVAAANDWPVVFTDAGELSDDARGFLIEADISAVHVVGSTDAVSKAVRDDVADLDGIDKVARHAGDNAYKTSVRVARDFFAIPSAYALVDGAEVATGAVAAAYAGERRHAPLLVTDGRRLGAAVTDYILETSSPDTSGILIGDRDTVRPRIERELRRVLR